MAMNLDLVPVSEWGFFTLPKPMVIAGPCSAESEEQVMETARGLKELGIHVFRAGVWKPRTHPGGFEGYGTPALKWLARVKKELGMFTCCEVANEKHVYECIKHGVDMLWVGARTSANPFLMQELADAISDADIPVLVKNPVNPDLELWIGALERLNCAGVRKLGVVHRGFTTSQKMAYRNDPGWNIALQLRTLYPNLPFFADPSHMGGSRQYLLELSQRALDLGLDGLMIEAHNNPSCALSDAKQQLTPDGLAELLGKIVVRDPDSDSSEYRENINQLRTRIDVLDENILHLLKQRMEISEKIGQYKKDHNIAIVQASRWDSLLADIVEKGLASGMSEEFLNTVFAAIHTESVRKQNNILEGK